MNDFDVDDMDNDIDNNGGKENILNRFITFVIELFDKTIVYVKKEPLTSVLTILTLLMLIIIGGFFLGNKALDEIEYTKPDIDVQGVNGSGVINGSSLDGANDAAYLYVSPGEVNSDDLIIPEVPKDVLEQGNHGGQHSVNKFIPGEGANDVDVSPRAMAPRAEGPPGVDKSLANTLQIGLQRFPVVPSGDNGRDMFTPPENPALVGWYQNSAEPGTDEKGSVIMSSHIDYGGKPGVGKVFAALNPGDVVKTWNTEGKEVRWKVVNKYNNPKEGEMAGVVNKMDGEQSLVLITCGGKYLGPPLYYQDNIVVEAVKI